MQAFEYHAVIIAQPEQHHSDAAHAAQVAALDALGLEGWELIGLTPAGPSARMFYFKRAISEAEAAKRKDALKGR